MRERRHRRGGFAPASPAGIGGSSSPIRGARSATSEPSPVETVTTPVLPCPTRRPSRRELLDERRGFEQLVEVVAPDDARGVQGRLGGARVAGEGARMRHRGRLRLRAPPDLHREHGHVHRQRPIREGEESLGPLEALDEQDDRVGRGSSRHAAR